MANIQQKKSTVPVYSKIKAVSSDFWGKPVYEGLVKGSLICPGYTGNDYSLNPWDTLRISLEGPFDEFETRFAEQQTPGIIQSFVVNKGLAVDRKKPAGGNNARITLHGLNLGEVEIHIKLWTPMQWELLKKLWKRIQPTSGKQLPSPFNCYHPELKPHNITALQFLDGEGPVPGPQPGVRIFIMKAIEFSLPSRESVTKTDEKPISSTLDAAPSSPGKNSKNTGPN